MSVTDLEAVIDRALVDRQFRRLVNHWPESLHADYAVSADELDALRTRDSEELVRLGLDQTRAHLATHLA
jgi:hypothetical protein